MSKGNRPSCASRSSLTRNVASCQAPSGVPQPWPRPTQRRPWAATHVGCRTAGSRVLLRCGHPRHRKAEPLEDLTDGAARSRSIEEPGNDISGRQVWKELA